MKTEIHLPPAPEAHHLVAVRRAFSTRAARAHCARVLSEAEAAANKADAAVREAREAYAAAQTADVLAYLAAYPVHAKI